MICVMINWLDMALLVYNVNIVRNEDLKSLVLKGRASVFQMATELYLYNEFCGIICQTVGLIRKRRELDSLLEWIKTIGVF
jgi:hypothetical protein